MKKSSIISLVAAVLVGAVSLTLISFKRNEPIEKTATKEYCKIYIEENRKLTVFFANGSKTEKEFKPKECQSNLVATLNELAKDDWTVVTSSSLGVTATASNIPFYYENYVLVKDK